MNRRKGEPIVARGEPARLTPYELAFAGTPAETEGFPAIVEEARARGVEPDSPARFAFLASTGRLLRELMPDAGPGEAAALRHGEVVERWVGLLFHAFRFWQQGQRLFLLEEPLARELAGPHAPPGDGRLHAPHPAGYVQLPRHLFWARIDESAPPEPVDGFFWSVAEPDAEGDGVTPGAPSAEGGRLDTLFVVGMRPDRPGFGSIDVGAPLAEAPAGDWAEVDARPDGVDFANILPGGELRGLLALVTPLEALELVSRLFRHLHARPEALGPEERGEVGGVAGAAGAGQPFAFPPTALPFRRIGGAV